MSNDETANPSTPGPHFYTGATILVIGFLLPLLIPFVSYLDVSTETRALISGILLSGGPEVFSLIAIAIMGKPGFIYKIQGFCFIETRPARRRSQPHAL